MKLDLNFVRSQFPAFKEASLEGWAFFENAGGSYPCKQFIKLLTDFYMKNKVQPYYPYPASQNAGALMDASYTRMASYLNVNPEEIHFGPSTTQNVYVLANAMLPICKNGDEIVVSCQDHEANSGAWRRLKNRGVNVIEWPVDPENGMLSVRKLKKILSSRTKIVAYPHCSNVIGHINPVEDISKLAHSVGAMTVVDGVGYAPHGFPNLDRLGADVYLFSLYKTFGPHLGMMYINSSLMSIMKNQSHFFKDGDTRGMFTPAGPDHAQIASVNGILDYFDTIYEHHFNKGAAPNDKNNALKEMFRDHETELLTQLLEFLRSRDDVQIIGPDIVKDRLPIVSIIPQNKSIQEVYKSLVHHKLMAGYGHFYAVRPLLGMNIDLNPGVLRFSFVHYTSKEEIEQLIEGLSIALSS
ncbi:aminotransferase class V-fold PLP-dependent enzyme [Yeosuana sp. MJ-SS3]|jgi:selenocysteine lyase/cysteine desulfurase|uniref:Aminotransferase class V-fold PLP-dependent enzyme n=1 Tax=Gilvirhabdus luticola TaxID=3079858 RepID=A0ABU3U295_9FLAO|nr:aminotransferase class V-fold PLP-dependent enzyme [Yeosuana sp. MJ-SS3]MDU8884536.1 aminotransferase class V-fold PLP-dependent enzyme [Yeosuana sp. MJ-SS3]